MSHAGMKTLTQTCHVAGEDDEGSIQQINDVFL